MAQTRQEVAAELEAEFARYAQQAIKRIDKNELFRKDIGAATMMREQYDMRTQALIDLQGEKNARAKAIFHKHMDGNEFDQEFAKHQLANKRAMDEFNDKQIERMRI